jgi:high-affinity Fe2+/Pb2+ permease
MKHPAKYSKNQLILIVILAAIFIILILWLVSREPDKEEIPLQEGRLYQTSTLA